MATFPEQALGALHAVLGAASDAVLVPLVARAPRATLVGLAVLTALALLVVVRRVSQQAALGAAKRAMLAALFEVRLFRDEPRAVFAALGRLLAANGRYVAASLPAVAWMALPLLLVVAQLQAVYGYDGLRVGHAVLVTAELAEGQAALARSVALAPQGALRVEAAARLQGGREVTWRVMPTAPGAHALVLEAAPGGPPLVRKAASAGRQVARRSPLRSTSLVDQVLYPAEPGLPAGGPVARLSVTYPEPGLLLAAGVRVPWLVAYVVLTMGAAFALAGRLGVEL